MEKKILVYQAYGLEDVMRQTIFSIVSLLSFSPRNIEILVYTDDVKKFEGFFGKHPQVKLVEINKDQIKAWRGTIDFVHRVKVEILMDAAKKFVGPIFYCDGDTYFLSSPEQIFSEVNNRISLMHIAENALIEGKDPLSKKILKFCKKNQFDVGGDHVAIGASTVMWNAGVLGISEANKSLLPLVLQLTDQMHTLYKKHVMEQLAFSFFLQTRSSIKAADHVIYHYWNQKDEYQKKIDEFLIQNTTIETALTSYAGFEWPGPPQPKKKKRLFSIPKIFKRKK